MITKKFAGTGVALTTPFLSDGTIDEVSLSKQLDYVLKGKVNYIVLFGTTGESSTISIPEKQKTAKFVLSYVAGKVPLVMGFGGNNTSALAEQIKSFDFTGIDAILSVCPYYNKPNQEGIYRHFEVICKASKLPFIIYNIPGRSVINIEPSTTLRIAENIENVIGIKEATDNLDHVMDLISIVPEDFLVIAGDDALALPFISLGASGAISVIANAYPDVFSQMVKVALDGDFHTARKLHYTLLPLMHTLLKCGNPSGIKATLSIIGLCENNFRLPVYGVNKAQYDAIRNEILKLQ